MRTKVFFILLGFFALGTCATYKTLDVPSPFVYQVTNLNWNQATVAFICDERIVKRERDISTTRTRTDALPVAECRNPRFVVSFLGSRETLTSPTVIGWGRGEVLFITITNALSQTTHTLRAGDDQ